MMWTERRVEALKKLWSGGLSASQIAGQLGGVTRNAVIGKARRLGLRDDGRPRRPHAPRVPCAPRPARLAASLGVISQTIKSGGGASKAARAFRSTNFDAPRSDKRHPLRDLPRPRRIVSPADATPPDASSRCALIDLQSFSCRFPHGDPGEPDFVFCGAPQAGSGPYCAYHHALTHGAGQREAAE